MSEIASCFLIVDELVFLNNLKARRGLFLKKNATSNIFFLENREKESAWGQFWGGEDSRSFQSQSPCTVGNKLGQLSGLSME